MSEGEGASKLAVLFDGAMLPEAEAKALWVEFSAHMDAHQGDMAGFAKKKAWFSVSPEYRAGKAVLVVRTTERAPAPPPPNRSKKRPKRRR
jgi:hypothetical protein